MAGCGDLAVVAHVPQAGLPGGGPVVRLDEAVLVRRRLPLGSTVIDYLGQIEVFHDHSVRL
jgi:hypothetical protein